MSILAIKNVSYQYKNKYQTVQALDEVNFQFEEGKVYAMVGKSGSGKTTLLSLMAGLDLPTTGEIVFGETSTRQMDRDQYRREDVTVIYQTYNLLPLLTVLENVMYPLLLRGVSKKDAREIAAQNIQKVDMEPEIYANRLPGMLSGGQRQRIAIARALATQSKVILADEPTGNLDSKTELEVISMLKSCVSEYGQTLVMITHDETIAQMADRMIVIEDGKVVRA